MLDKLLEKAGLDEKELKKAEVETLQGWLDDLKVNELTVGKIKSYIQSMREAIEEDVSKTPAFKRVFVFKVENRKLVSLQARLRNYLLLEAFLSSPEKAKQQIEEAVSRLAIRAKNIDKPVI